MQKLLDAFGTLPEPISTAKKAARPDGDADSKKAEGRDLKFDAQTLIALVKKHVSAPLATCS